LPLRRADVSKTKRFEDEDAFLVLRTRLNAHDLDTINDLSSNYRLPASMLVAGVQGPEGEPQVEFRGNAREINRSLFALLSVEWSLSDGKPTAVQYDELDRDSKQWVDDCVQEALKEGRERAEGNPPSSARQNGSRNSSPKAPRSKPTSSSETSSDSPDSGRTTSSVA
jgi:hypothetical protein